MRVSVTGGAGFIGSRLVPRLVDQGHEVTVLDVVAPDAAHCAHAVVSVLDLHALTDALDGADAVVHLAGVVREGMRRQPFDGARLHLQGTLNVLEACRRNGVGHIGYASSFYVYDGIPSSDRVDESALLDPRTCELFGSSKLMGEALCKEYSQRCDLTYTAFRFGPVYGAGGSSAVDDFIETGLRGRPIEIWGRGERRNQYTHVDDVAVAVAVGLGATNEAFNVVSPESTSLRALGELLREELGFQLHFDESRPEGPSFPYISADKASQRLGWEPVPLRQGVRATARLTAGRLGIASD